MESNNTQVFSDAYTNTTTINSLGLLMLLSCCFVLFSANRKIALWPIFIMVFFVSQAQRIAIFTLDFNQMRIIALVGLMRILFKERFNTLKPHKLDKFMIWYAVVSAIIHIIRSGGGAIVFELGHIVDLLAPYFVFRCLIRNYEDMLRAIKIISVLSMLVACFFIIEYSTTRNMFYIFGGVPEITTIREGKLRCQGAFSHPILAGTFFAVMMPLFLSLWWNKLKVLAVVGGISGLVIIGASNSSTSILSLLSAILAALFFPLRTKMKTVRWSIYTLLIALHLTMNAPVWSLISRISATGGSTSWFRFMLIDTTINHFSSWWLIGTSSYVDWYTFGLVDLTNQFVATALGGGLMSLILYIYIIAIGFGTVGRIWRAVQSDKEKIRMAWAMGCSLFALMMSFIGVALWGQIFILWAFVLASIASMDNYFRNIEKVGLNGEIYKGNRLSPTFVKMD